MPEVKPAAERPSRSRRTASETSSSAARDRRRSPRPKRAAQDARSRSAGAARRHDLSLRFRRSDLPARQRLFEGNHPGDWLRRAANVERPRDVSHRWASGRTRAERSVDGPDGAPRRPPSRARTRVDDRRSCPEARDGCRCRLGARRRRARRGVGVDPIPGADGAGHGNLLRGPRVARAGERDARRERPRDRTARPFRATEPGRPGLAWAGSPRARAPRRPGAQRGRRERTRAHRRASLLRACRSRVRPDRGHEHGRDHRRTRGDGAREPRPPQRIRTLRRRHPALAARLRTSRGLPPSWREEAGGDPGAGRRAGLS